MDLYGYEATTASHLTATILQQLALQAVFTDNVGIAVTYYSALNFGGAQRTSHIADYSTLL